MNKKLNTVLFILGATLFNVIVAVISFIMFFILYVRFLHIKVVPENNISWVVSLLLLAAIAVSIFVYRFALKKALNKIDVEKYFDPLFVKKPH